MQYGVFELSFGRLAPWSWDQTHQAHSARHIQSSNRDKSADTKQISSQKNVICKTALSKNVLVTLATEVSASLYTFF